MKFSKTIKLILLGFIPLLLAAATFYVIIITRGGSITDNGIIINTGIIKIYTEPQNLSSKYYLNEKEIILQQNNSILNIPEGVHQLQITTPEYITWTKSIQVRKNIVTEVHAKLFPDEKNIVQVTFTNIDKAVFSDLGDYAFYTVKESEIGSDLGIWKLPLFESNFLFLQTNTHAEKIANMSSELKTVLDSNYTLIPSPNNTKLLILNKDTQSYYLLEQQIGSDAKITPIESLLGYKPDYINWLNDSVSILVQDGTLLYEFNLTNKVSTIIQYAKDKNIVYSLNNNRVFVYDKAGTISIYRNQTLESIKMNNINLPTDINKIFSAVTNDRYLIIGTVSNYYFIDVEKGFIKEITDTSNKLLTLSNNGLSAMFVKDSQLSIFNAQENIALNTIETQLKMISDDYTYNPDTMTIRFVPQSSHLLILDSEKQAIYSIENDGDNLIEVLSAKGITTCFNFNNKAEYLIVMLIDEQKASETDPGSKRSNFYKVNFNTSK